MMMMKIRISSYKLAGLVCMKLKSVQVDEDLNIWMRRGLVFDTNEERGKEGRKGPDFVYFIMSHTLGKKNLAMCTIEPEKGPPPLVPWLEKRPRRECCCFACCSTGEWRRGNYTTITDQPLFHFTICMCTTRTSIMLRQSHLYICTYVLNWREDEEGNIVDIPQLLYYSTGSRRENRAMIPYSHRRKAHPFPHQSFLNCSDAATILLIFSTSLRHLWNGMKIYSRTNS